MKAEIIGAWLDKLFLIGTGSYWVFGYEYSIYSRVNSGKISAEKGESQIKKLKFCGWAMLSAGVVMLLLALGQYGLKLSP